MEDLLIKVVFVIYQLPDPLGRPGLMATLTIQNLNIPEKLLGSPAYACA